MITGATLMDYRDRYDLKTYFKKRVHKTVIPFFAWSMIGILCKLALGKIQGSELSVSYVWNGIFGTTVIPMYWYFQVLFCIYLFMPLFAAVNKKYRKEVFTYAAVAGFILTGVVPLICNTLLKGYSWGVDPYAFSSYLLFIPAGYLISEYDIKKNVRRFIYVAGAAGFLMHLAGTYFLSVRAGAVINTFKGYTNAPCIMYSTGIMVWLKYNYERLSRFRLVRLFQRLIAPYTLSIYLMQYFIYISMLTVFNIDETSLLYRLGAPFVIIPVIIAATWLIRKIPLIRVIAP